MAKKKTTPFGRKKRQSKGDKIKIIVSAIIFGVVLILGLVLGLVNYLGFGEVTFNFESGFYEQDIAIKIGVKGLLAIQPVKIKYNTNGDDLSHNSIVYDGEIALSAPETGYKLYTITATVCLDNEKCLEPKTMTYVLGKNLNENVTLKIININSAWENLYDYNNGILVGGATYDYNEKMDPEQIFIPGNYSNRDDKWMRNAHMTMFDVDGSLVCDSNILLGITGGTSAAYDVKSLKINIPAKEDEKNDEEFRLRAGSQDQYSGNVRSSVVSNLTKQSNFDGGNTTERVVVFLNGEYYGIFDKQINYSKNNLALRYGLSNKKKIEKYKGTEQSVFEKFDIDTEIWQDLNVEENREKLEEIVDMDDYLMYYAMQILLNNTDWPMNNYEGWRYVGKKSENKYEDGRIRFLLYDTDLTYYIKGNVKYYEGCIGDIFEFLMERKYNGRGSAFADVMESEYYRDKFVGILEELMNGPFATDNVLKIIDEEAAKIEHQVELFSTEEEYEEWKGWIELLKKAASERNGQLKEGVKKYLGVDLKF